eukprot:scaffold136057_cov19-Tisochrysis_lutea.AAC.1
MKAFLSALFDLRVCWYHTTTHTTISTVRHNKPYYNLLHPRYNLRAHEGTHKHSGHGQNLHRKKKQCPLMAVMQAPCTADTGIVTHTHTRAHTHAHAHAHKHTCSLAPSPPFEPCMAPKPILLSSVAPIPNCCEYGCTADCTAKGQRRIRNWCKCSCMAAGNTTWRQRRATRRAGRKQHSKRPAQGAQHQELVQAQLCCNGQSNVEAATGNGQGLSETAQQKAGMGHIIIETCAGAAVLQWTEQRGGSNGQR